jgi:hypothetical protein
LPIASATAAAGAICCKYIQLPSRLTPPRRPWSEGPRRGWGRLGSPERAHSGKKVRSRQRLPRGARGVEVVAARARNGAVLLGRGAGIHVRVRLVHSEGHRKVRVRLRQRGVHVGKARVLRLMRVQFLDRGRRLVVEGPDRQAARRARAWRRNFGPPDETQGCVATGPCGTSLGRPTTNRRPRKWEGGTDREVHSHPLLRWGRVCSPSHPAAVGGRHSSVSFSPPKIHVMII